MIRWIGLLAIAAALAAAGAASGGTQSAAMKTCDYKGPAWNVNGQKGNTWVLTYQKTTCAFGTTWAKNLAHAKTPRKYGAQLPGSPKGWRCQSLASGQKTVLSGSCTKGEKYFGWHPAY